MKTLFKIKLLVTLILFCCSNYLNAQEKVPSGYYFLAETSDNAILVKDVDSDEIFGIENNVALGVNDFKKIKVNKIDAFPNQRETIQVTLSSVGLKKWKAIKRRCNKSGENVVLVCDNNVYGQLFFNLGNAQYYTSKIDLCIPKEKINYILSILNAEINENNKL